MGFALFISDLHLAPARPRIVEQFYDLLAGPVQGAEALYVLGDLFEYWIGDDDLDDPLNGAVAQAFAQTAARGTSIYFMHGNRDLLVGAEFAKRAHARLLDDPALADLFGTRTLLMHGDTLCTDDTEYQRFRAYAHDAGNQARFLGQPVAARRAEAQALRAKSESAKKIKTDEIMDVSEAAVLEALRKTAYPPRLIHGHTHRPARHLHHVDGHECERWVLGDWYENGSYLRCDVQGCVAISLAQT